MLLEQSNNENNENRVSDTSMLSNNQAMIKQLERQVELHRSSTQYFDLRKMLKELQKKAKPKIDTNLDEAKRLAAIDME